MSSETKYAAVLPMPTCRLGVVCSRVAITELVFLSPETNLVAPHDPLSCSVDAALGSYLDDPCNFPEFSLAMAGSPFQRRVWAAISEIPCGQIRRYGEIAQTLASAPRAVGQACGANRFPLLIPCHRVLGSKGIGGFANHSDGWLIETKRWLLWHEGVLA